jgi:opacity protein-like surface antigen
MKKYVFVMVALFAFASVASAQVPNPISLHFGGAISIPNSPDAFADAYKTGYHGWAGVGYKVMPNLQIVGKIEFHTFKLDVDSDPLLLGTDISGGKNNMWMFGVDGRYSFAMPTSPLKPFVLGGLGFARMSMTDLEGSNPLIASFNEFKPEAQTDVYFNVGAGVELKTAPMWNMFLQVRYVSVATEGSSSSFIPVSLGVKFF